MSTLARVVHLIVSIIVLIILAGIVLVLLKANPTNAIVSDVHDAARWLAGPFDGIFVLTTAFVAKDSSGAGVADACRVANPIVRRCRWPDRKRSRGGWCFRCDQECCRR